MRRRWALRLEPEVAYVAGLIGRLASADSLTKRTKLFKCFTILGSVRDLLRADDRVERGHRDLPATDLEGLSVRQELLEARNPPRLPLAEDPVEHVDVTGDGPPGADLQPAIDRASGGTWNSGPTPLWRAPRSRSAPARSSRFPRSQAGQISRSWGQSLGTVGLSSDSTDQHIVDLIPVKRRKILAGSSGGESSSVKPPRAPAPHARSEPYARRSRQAALRG